jgi:hypothetical protein
MGRPSIIALYSTDRELVGPDRLFSYYFDLNQGMILAIPGILVCLPALSRNAGAGWRWRAVAHGAVHAGPGAADAVGAELECRRQGRPALRVLGRDAAAVPGLFVAARACALAAHAAGPRVPAAAWRHGPRQILRLSGIQPARALRAGPRAGPLQSRPEIFIERSRDADGGLDVQDVAVYPRQGQPRKVLFNAGSDSVDRLCVLPASACPRS